MAQIFPRRTIFTVIKIVWDEIERKYKYRMLFSKEYMVKKCELYFSAEDLNFYLIC